MRGAAEAFCALRASARQFGGIGSGIYPRARVPVPPRQRFALGLIQRRRVPVAAPLHFEHKPVPPEHAGPPASRRGTRQCFFPRRKLSEKHM
ncbi:MAG: hypothetical protein ACLSTO_01060 [Bilophila wadsworthia]